MPYRIKKIDDGYKVCKKDGSKCFSLKPLSIEKAKKQLKAIGISESLKGGNKEDILRELRKLKYLYLVGSAKRGENYNDLDFITKKDLKKCFEDVKTIFNDAFLSRNGYKFIQIKINNINVDIWKADEENFKSMKIMRTIDKPHSIAYKKLAKKNNLLLNDYGLFRNKIRIPFKHEKELRRLIGLGLNQNLLFKQLQNLGLTPKKYLNMARFVAKNRGYDPKLLRLSDDNVHKLEYNNIPFGRVSYMDKILYTWLEFNNKIEEGTTKKKYTNYRKRAYMVMKKTNNKYSPSSLSYYILW